MRSLRSLLFGLNTILIACLVLNITILLQVALTALISVIPELPLALEGGVLARLRIAIVRATP